MKKSKRFKEIINSIDLKKVYSVDDAIDVLKKCPAVKFDQSIEFSLRIEVDLKKTDQQVRGVSFLPKGTGKEIKILVFAEAEDAKVAISAGASYAGGSELIEKVKTGWLDFDVVVATPSLMKEVGKLGKILGPKGLMPTPKSGNVTKNVSQVVSELKKGKVEFKVGKDKVINNSVGKISFSKEDLIENIRSLMSSIIKSHFIKNINT